MQQAERIFLPIINPKSSNDLFNVPPLDESQIIPYEDLPEHVAILRSPFTNSLIYLIGTAHVSDVSARNVEELIHMVHPDSVFIELCFGRRGLLTQSKEAQIKPTWKDLVVNMKERTSLQTFTILLQMGLSNMTKDLKIQAGNEFIVATREGLKIGASIILGDRPIEVTFKRTWSRLSLWEKTKLVTGLLYALLIGFKVSADDVEKIKNCDLIEELMKDLAVKYPGTMETIVHERDLYLTSSLRHSPGRVIVAVVGLGHVNGIKENWEKEIDRKALLAIPVSKSSVKMKTLFIFLFTIITAIAVVYIIG